MSGLNAFLGVSIDYNKSCNSPKPPINKKSQFNFNMRIENSYASFSDLVNDKFIIVDTFNHQDFDVLYGTKDVTNFIGSVTAQTSEELNNKLKQLIDSYI